MELFAYDSLPLVRFTCVVQLQRSLGRGGPLHCKMTSFDPTAPIQFGYLLPQFLGKYLMPLLGQLDFWPTTLAGTKSAFCKGPLT